MKRKKKSIMGVAGKMNVQKSYKAMMNVLAFRNATHTKLKLTANDSVHK